MRILAWECWLGVAVFLHKFVDEADFHPQVGRTSPLGLSSQLRLENKSSGTKLCSGVQTICEGEYWLGWVGASTRVLNVVCGVKRQEIVVINGKVFFNSADYNMIINVTRLARLLRLQLG